MREKDRFEVKMESGDILNLREENIHSSRDCDSSSADGTAKQGPDDFVGSYGKRHLTGSSGFRYSICGLG